MKRLLMMMLLTVIALPYAAHAMQTIPDRGTPTVLDAVIEAQKHLDEAQKALDDIKRVTESGTTAYFAAPDTQYRTNMPAVTGPSAAGQVPAHYGYEPSPIQPLQPQMQPVMNVIAGPTEEIPY